MIDQGTRSRIIELWRKGLTKTAIRQETGISAPSIRRIIKESDQDRTRRYYHPLRSGDTLLLNTTRHWPAARSRNVHERLMNGCAFRLLPNVLQEIYPPNLVDKIINEITMKNLEGSIIEVCIYLDENDNVVVKAFGLYPK